MGLLGVSARSEELSETDRGVEVFGDDNREMAAWIYPADPDLPDLERVAHPKLLAALVNGARLLPYPVTGGELESKIVGYRPGCRAVVRFTTGENTPYIEAIRARLFGGVLFRHQMLIAAGMSTPHVAHTTSGQLMILDALQSRPLARVIFDPGDPCTPEQPIEMLDSTPPSVA